MTNKVDHYHSDLFRRFVAFTKRVDRALGIEHPLSVSVFKLPVAIYMNLVWLNLGLIIIALTLVITVLKLPFTIYKFVSGRRKEQEGL